MDTLLILLILNLIMTVACAAFNYMLLQAQKEHTRQHLIAGSKPVFSHKNKQIMKVIREVNKQ